MLWLFLWIYLKWRFLLRKLRRYRGQIKVLSVILEFPDLPPLDADALDYIEKLTATSPELEFGSLSHYVKDQSHGRRKLAGSKVFNLGPVLPLYTDLFESIPELGHSPVPTGYNNFRPQPIISQRLGLELAKYDVIIIYFNGNLPLNAISTIYEFTLVIKYMGQRVSHVIKRSAIKLGLGILKNRMTSSVFHEMFHVFHFENGLSSSLHAPFIEGDELKNSTGMQLNPWHNLSSEREWGQTVPFYNTVAVGASAYNCCKNGWYHSPECLMLTAPFSNKEVMLRTTICPPQLLSAFPLPSRRFAESVYICQINTSGLPNHPEGYMLEARACQGYDLNLYASGVLVHKLAMFEQFPSFGYLPFLLGPLPPPSSHGNYWHKYILTMGESFDREGIHIEVTDVINDANGAPLVFEVNVTVQ